jgi:hypothetical protein
MISWKIVERLLAPLGILCSLAISSWPQDKSAIPEFFGFYALENGKTVSIHEGQGSISPKAEPVDLYSLANNSTVRLSIPQLSTGTRFILFYANAGEMVKDMTLHRLPLLRNFVETPDPQDQAMATLTGRTLGPRVVASPNQPFLSRVPDLELRILSKPVPNQAQMIEMASSPQLTPGLYVLDYDKGPHGNDGWFVVFAIRATAEAENSYCLDLALQGGMGAQYFRANSSLGDTVPLLRQGQYQQCVGGQTAVASPPVTASPPSVSPAMRTAEWDRELSLRHELTLPACQDHGFVVCTHGTLVLGATSIKFIAENNVVLETPLSDVRMTEVKGRGQKCAVGIEVKSKKYKFFLLTPAAQCDTVAAEYLSKTIPKLLTGGTT